MPHIAVLDKNVYELIAAGEVIERPASVVKELVENSIDSGAKHIQVEIKQGGIEFIRVTDDGCGIARGDVETAFKRHATSKISEKGDLDNIQTLGFRGEALASVAAVSKVSLMTKRREDEIGSSFSISADEKSDVLDSGCPNGTTIIIRDLFWNVPARRKFLKKESVEGNAVGFIIRKVTLTHPEISFRFIRDNKSEFLSSGSGDLKSAIYAIYGKDFANDSIPLDYKLDDIRVSGYILKPLYSRANRTYQNFFVDRRYISSKLLSQALESGYENLVMVGKFPACVLNIEIPPSGYDVNIHPAKAEVRFSDEKKVSDAVYFGVKDALMHANLIYDFRLPEANPNRQWKENNIGKNTDFVQPKIHVNNPEANHSKNIAEKSSERELRAETIIREMNMYKPDSADEESQPNKEENITITVNEKMPQDSFQQKFREVENDADVENGSEIQSKNLDNLNIEEKADAKSEQTKVSGNECKTEAKEDIPKEEHTINVIGEAFKKYIIAEADGDIIFIDKHAAHERVIFEKLKRGVGKLEQQYLLTPCKILLSSAEFSALSENSEKLLDLGFIFDFSNPPEAVLKAEPSFMEDLDAGEIVEELATNFLLHKQNPQTHLYNDLLHSMACKAAIKSHYNNLNAELQYLADEIFENQDVRHCPHGRPILFRLSEYELDKQFRRKGL